VLRAGGGRQLYSTCSPGAGVPWNDPLASTASRPPAASTSAAWDACDITYDHFVRTTDSYHISYVQEFFARLYDAGDITFGRYGGLYCFGCERFYTPKELRDGKCPDHLVAPMLAQMEAHDRGAPLRDLVDRQAGY
jgi:hypothetical protein